MSGGTAGIYVVFVVIASHLCLHAVHRMGPEKHKDVRLVENSLDSPSLVEGTSSWRLALCLRLDDGLKYEPRYV